LGGGSGETLEFNQLLVNYPLGGTTYIISLQGMTSWMAFQNQDMDEYHPF
jgi:hypothetical protein